MRRVTIDRLVLRLPGFGAADAHRIAADAAREVARVAANETKSIEKLQVRLPAWMSRKR